MMAEQITELEAQIATALDADPDGEIFRSFLRSRDFRHPRRHVASRDRDYRDRHPHRDAIAANNGQAPVAVQSDNRKNAKLRWACNKRPPNALATLAHNTRRWNPRRR